MITSGTASQKIKRGMAPPKVSVSIITYNHQDYIGRAIESVLDQRVDFEYEIIIGDDYSTDGTRAVLRDYQQRYPHLIQLILHPRHPGGIPGRLNNVTNLYACRGTYVALLDGDDYWIDHHKLQRQVDFLDQHPDYILTFHDVIWVSADQSFDEHRHSSHYEIIRADSDRSFVHADLLAYPSFIPTSSVVYRNGLIGEFPAWFWEIISADHALQLLLSRTGRVKYFSWAGSVYLKHSRSFMALHYYDPAILRLKIKELQLYLKVFLPFRHDQYVYRNLRVFYRICRRIAFFKYQVIMHFIGERKYIAVFLYLLTSSLSHVSFIFYPSIVLKELKKRLKLIICFI